MTKDGKAAIINADVVQFNPSTRLEQLAVGTKNMQKINYLIKNKVFDKSLVDNNVSNALKLTKKLSRTKFDLNFNKTTIDPFLKTKSFVKKYLSNKNGPDEIEGYKIIINNLKQVTRSYINTKEGL
ncbi:hypothetical protein [Mesoplasma melaleucae]|uniref:Uncharacterized protein n=1 Tax=Mesoplasma melaleucae TaxID=81459 RepID=A0A2K8NX70_9MOLU|nr:hypothetical protein [Mesoplasma melaleucae]ATZ18136.1 hypothetical protein EMELA_v1c06280 [Mesoplasma melaleucae]